jgi:hypothetical protein
MIARYHELEKQMSGRVSSNVSGRVSKHCPDNVRSGSEPSESKRTVQRWEVGVYNIPEDKLANIANSKSERRLRFNQVENRTSAYK